MSDNDRETLSIIIPTKNRPQEIATLTRCILQQSLLPEELVVIDQSVSDEGRKLVEKEFAGRFGSSDQPIKLHYIMDPTLDGSAAARNLAMTIATGDVWLYLDDDVLLEADFVEQLLATYAHYPDVAGVSGIITNYTRPRWNCRLWDAVFARGPFHDERQPIYWNAEKLRNAPPIRVGKFGGGLMSLRASLVRGIRFDSNLTGASLAEDVDLCAKLVGLKLVISPQARLIHKRSTVGRAKDHWLRSHAQSSHYLYRRHWNSELKNRIFFAWLKVGYALAIVSGCVKRGSLEPLRAFAEGVAKAELFASCSRAGAPPESQAGQFHLS